MSIRPLTPKEFSAAIGGLRSADWVREQCAAYVKRQAENRRRAARGLPALPAVGIHTLTDAPPYMIPGSELERFRPNLAAYAVNSPFAV